MPVPWKHWRQIMSISACLFLLLALLFVTSLRRQQASVFPTLIKATPLKWHTLLSPAGKWAALDVPGDFRNTEANGINNSGHIVGTFDDADNRQHAYLFDGTYFHVIDVPKTTAGPGEAVNNCGAEGINNEGDIVGSYEVDGDPKGHGPIRGRTYGFLLSHGKYVTIDDPKGFTITTLFDINDKGQILVQDYDGTHTHGFLWQNGTFTPLRVPNATDVTPMKISNNGEIVGDCTKVSPTNPDAIVNYGFVLDSRGCHFLPDNRIIQGMSVQGEVGYHGMHHGRAFIQRRGIVTELDIPNSVLSNFPFGINDQSEIIGTYNDGNSQSGEAVPAHAYLFVPRSAS